MKYVYFMRGFSKTCLLGFFLSLKTRMFLSSRQKEDTSYMRILGPTSEEMGQMRQVRGRVQVSMVFSLLLFFSNPSRLKYSPCQGAILGGLCTLNLNNLLINIQLSRLQNQFIFSSKLDLELVCHLTVPTSINNLNKPLTCIEFTFV